MKKISIILAALAAAFAVSCNKEAVNTEVPDTSAPAGMKQVTITASIENADTKTSYDAAGKFSWTKGDKISVFCSDKKFYEFVADETGATATFTGYIPEGITLRNDYAFFPADPGHRREGDNYYYTIPEYKDLSSAFSADIPMGAFMNNDVYEFNHITGAALFTFTNIPEGVETVKITFTHSVKLSGEWGTYHDTTDEGAKCWTIGAYNASTESEGTYCRTVSVADNEAKVYLPYPPGSTIWSGLAINVVGYDELGNELILLKDQKTKQDITLPRATVIPIAPLALPDYVPSVDWNKVDWTAENVASVTNSATSDDAILEEMKVVADNYYMYVWIKSSLQTPYGANYIDILLSDGDYISDGNSEADNAAKAWDQWPGTLGIDLYKKEHKGTIDAESGNITSMTFNHNGNYENIEFKNEIVDGKINWYLAFPLDYIEMYKSDSSTVHVGFRLWTDWNNFAAIPARGWGQSMLEVTLP